ncbi:zinc finger transcription factor 1 [Metarhizium album ARSEF 1941]|uniref:Zinc finger transcription factor 1 n=1 Tax=Metarhizium album (strain ARSEF 1941) TaxID=1081103 RepID=A0A0B2X5G7_METAS|nr:zinc finger transcription factor 1 [Metarhizium album ARSEF 1941]KHO00695.1 zinc finger transcription factor 1 [Metarhizium album ARSEF 1941]
MSGSQHRINSHHIQHVQQALLDPAASHRIYDNQKAGALNGGSPAIMDGSPFPDFAFSFGSLSDQGPMAGMPEAGFGNPSNSDFAHIHGLGSTVSPARHPLAALPSMPASSFAPEQSDGSASLEMAEDAMRDGTSPADHAFEDTGTDEFGLPGHPRADGTDLGTKNKDDKAGHQPAWSELKTKAGKDRKRLPLACIACRRKKIRCSGEKPACKHCLRSRIPCVYKVTTRKAAPRTDYMAMLDKRLKRMEDRIIKIIPKPDQDAVCAVARAVVRPAMPGTSQGNKCPSKKRGVDGAFGADLEAWAKGPPTKVKASCDGVCDGPDDASLSPDDGEPDENLLFQEGTDALPSKEVQEHLAEIFFDNVYGQAYHLLHKPSFMRKLKNNTLPPVLILSVCAVAARFAPQYNIRPDPRPFLRGEEWASCARDICTRRYEWPNMTILTCLIILGLHEFGTCHGGRSWALGGQAIRMAFALQLHKDLEFDPSRRGNKTPLSFIDREIRRRIMWACFLMDRFNSSGSDRPMFIKEECIRIQLPVKESYFQLDMPAETELLDGSRPPSGSPDGKPIAQAGEHMGVAAYTIRAVAIWGRIVSYLHQGGKEMDSHPLWSDMSDYTRLVQHVDKLQRTLPDSLQYSMDNLGLHTTEKTASQFLLMHLTIQHNILILYKAANAWQNSGARGTDAPLEFLAQASAKTVAAANRISEILRDAEHAKCNVTAPFAGYCAFSATSIHIPRIFSGNPEVKATAEVNAGINIKFLRKTMRYWGTFHWLVENIRSQYRNALEASRCGRLGAQGPAAWSVLQYSDWFDRYPHGVSDFDVVEPTSQRNRDKGEDAVLEQKPELHSVEDFFTSLASPSTPDGKAASQGPAAIKRKQPSKNTSDLLITRQDSSQSGESAMGQRSGGLLRIQTPVSGSQHAPVSLGGQTSGSGVTGFSSAGLSQAQAQQAYTAMSPMSPVQVASFPRQGCGQSPYFSSDILQMHSIGQPPNDRPQNLDGQVSYGYTLSPGNQNVMDGSTPNWHAKGQPKMPNPDQRVLKMESGQDQPQQPHNQGQIGAAGLDAFTGSDLPDGWFMPFVGTEPSELQSVNPSGPGGETGCGVDSFGSMFGANAMTMPHAMDGLRHTL